MSLSEELVRSELALANKKYEQLTKICQNPYASQELYIRRREQLSYCGGLAKALEQLMISIKKLG